jgi:glycolate oxidase FAD binding subunit
VNVTTLLSEESEVDELSDLCPARAAGQADQLDGTSVRWVALPRDLTQVTALLRYADEHRLVVLPRGGGSKLSWLDPPPVIDVLLDLSALDACRYDPESNLLTAGAGVPVAMAQDELSRAGRRLVLDPASARATIGGVLVTAESGPLAHMFGPPALHLVDATVVLPDGTVTTVADRARLLGASVRDLRWAHSGWPHPASVVVEATLQTYPIPPASAWVTCPVGQPREAALLRNEVLAANLSPAGIELDLPGLRRGGPLPGRRTAAGTLAVLFEGAPVSLTDRARQLMSHLGADAHLTSHAPAWWGRLPFRPDEVAVRLNAPDGELAPVCYALADAVGSLVPVRGSLGVGLAWAAVPSDLPGGQLIMVLETLREVLLARGGSAVVQAAPPRLRSLVAPYRVP